MERRKNLTHHIRSMQKISGLTFRFAMLLAFSALVYPSAQAVQSDPPVSASSSVLETEPEPKLSFVGYYGDANPPGTPSRKTVSEAATRLGLPPEALQLGVEGLGHVYARRYGQAEAVFEHLTAVYPGSAIGPFGRVLLYQSWMLENFDFLKEKECLKASKEGIERSEKAIDQGQSAAWNHFVKGVLEGIDSIYDLRKGQYFTALSAALKAISNLETAAELDSAFVDPVLGLGVYNYWRTILSEKYWFLPSYSDHREEGMAQIYTARDYGIFTGPGARLALAYTHLQNHQVKLALKNCQELHALYPDNVINNMLLGRIALRQRKMALAKSYFGRVRKVDPQNWMVEYYLGVIAGRERKYKKAELHYLSFLKNPGDVGGQGFAHFRLGDVYWHLHKDALAEEHWKKALKLYPSLSAAERRLQGTTPSRKGKVDVYVKQSPESGGKKAASGRGPRADVARRHSNDVAPTGPPGGPVSESASQENKSTKEESPPSVEAPAEKALEPGLAPAPSP